MAELSYWQAVEVGDPETVADAEERLGLRRRHDPVADTPATLLHRLVEMTPPERRDALIDEIIARRPGVFQRQ